MGQEASRWPQAAPRRPYDAPQMPPRWSKRAQRCAKMVPRDLRMDPRWTKLTLRWTKDGSKRDHKGQNGTPNAFKMQNWNFQKNIDFPYDFQRKCHPWESKCYHLELWSRSCWIILDSGSSLVGYVGSSWAMLTHLGSILGSLEESWGHLGTSWGQHEGYGCFKLRKVRELGCPGEG